MAALDLALSRIQDDAGDCLPPEAINQLARDSGHVFRNTRLTPGNTLRLFAQQRESNKQDALHSNRSASSLFRSPMR